jgi:bilirubin oxidase
MGITSTSGTGLTTNPGNPTVLAVTNGTQFTLNSTVTAVPATLTAAGVALVLNAGDTTYTDTMATITNPINATSATTGTVQFYAQTQNFVSNNGWAFQVSPDGGTTWNTRISENYAGETVTVAGCTLNATTTVSCSSVAGLSAGMAVQSANLAITGCTTSSTTNPTVVTPTDTTDLANLAVGMYIVGTGIPANTRVIAVGGTNGANTFTMSGNASASGTVTVTANYLPANAVINTINTTANTFTFNTGVTVFANASGVTLFATTVNHGFILEQYALAASEMTANLKFRFQFSGYTPIAPIKAPSLDIDDITVTLVNGVPPVTVAMTSTGNGTYTGQIPPQAAGATVSYTVTALDSSGASTTSTASSYNVVTSAPVLAVTPATSLTASGDVGGPFTPGSATYTVSNTGVGSMAWTASNTTTWLTLFPTGGTLAAGASTSVTATINPTANTLIGGNYTDTITFTNTTNGTGNTSEGVTLSAAAPPAAPVVAALPAILNGSYDGVTWPAVAGATSYIVQVSLSPNFSSPLLTQTFTSNGATFSNLTDGITYYYRVGAVNNAGTSGWSATVSSVEDATPPRISITSPAAGASTAATSITVTGTSSDATSGIASVMVNNTVAATTTNGYATWTATVPVGFGTTVITATAVNGAGTPATTPPFQVIGTTQQTYNPLRIPDLLRGPTFNLTLDQTTMQYLSGPATQTYSYNKAGFWGPTLLMRQGDYIQVNLTNNLPATTTTHWHGFHIPAIMDGGPHEVIAAGATWTPSFYMKNQAATFWYHPHLHPTTQQQLTLGAGGLIIVQDPQEAALTLPRTYGVDDFPLVLTSRTFLTAGIGTNQFATQGAFGNQMLVNGTLTPQMNLPAQIVRLRILDAEIARNHNLGFSDNRTFYVIGSDGGLLNAPVPVTRMVMGSAERYEILLDLRGATPGTFVDLTTYNANQWTGYSGGQPGTTGANGSLLNNINFVDLHINIVAPTDNPVTTLPTTLANNVYWTAANVTNSRTVQLTGVGGAPLRGRLKKWHSRLGCGAGGHPARRKSSRRDAYWPHRQDACATS